MSRPSDQHKTLLIVDDDWRLRRMLQWSFDDLGYAAWTAGSHAEASQVLDALQFDYALLDLQLPDGSGATLGYRLLQERPRARVALMSADRQAVETAANQVVGRLGHGVASRIETHVKPLRPLHVDRWYRA